ncbi:helix-turn-helix domain-containing protein [Scatolibacter rhodanostii]|uniref:helix-turn-helix domain-containing protein n=1 Tax=Scatolibacter rhodanostii TaxID=2014781 RepID=UPI000C06B3EB|nr:helix-turn-helix domain-containing protein [Scatolibacter rhodanostii]
MKKNTQSLGKGLDFTFFKTIFAVVIIVDIVLSVLLGGLFSGRQLPYSKEQSVMQIEQVCTSIDILYSSLEACANQILADADTYASLAAEKIDRLQEHKSGQRLKYLKSANPYIRYAGFYNSATDRYLSNAYVGIGKDINVNELYQKSQGKKSVCLTRTVGSSYPTAFTNTTPVYTFVFPISLSPSNNPPDLIILDVNASFFNEVLSNISLEDVYQQIAFLDADNTLITKKEAQKGEFNFSSSTGALDFDTADMYSRSTSSGSFSYSNASGSYNFVTYARAEKADWVVVNIIPYLSFLSPLFWIGLLTFTLFLVTLGMGYVLSRRASLTLYAPIRQLYVNYVNTDSNERTGNEIDLLSEAFLDMYQKADKLEQGLISSYTQSKNLYLLKLLHGEIHHVKESFSAYERLQIDLSSPYYGMLMIECLPTTAQNNHPSDANLFIFHYALENVTKELTDKYCRSEFLRLRENLFVSLLYLPENLVPLELAEDLKMIPQVMKKEFEMDTSVCIGSLADSWQNINMIYEQTQIAMNARTIDRQGQVFFSVEKNDSMSADHYYNRLDLKFAEYVRSHDLSSCEKEFDVAIAKMENISFKTARSYFKHIMMSILDNFSFLFGKDDESFRDMMELLESLDNKHNVKQIRNSCLNFLTVLMTQLNYNKQNSNLLAAEKVKQYVQNNYANPDLSLKMLSGIVNLSPAYLGKIFSAATSYSFTDYLSLIRITKAAELLKSTKQSIVSISESVGILNTNYFYSLFKKHFNMTPSEYRKHSKNET